MSKIWFITGTSKGFGCIWARGALDRGNQVAATARMTAAVAVGALAMLATTGLAQTQPVRPTAMVARTVGQRAVFNADAHFTTPRSSPGVLTVAPPPGNAGAGALKKTMDSGGGNPGISDGVIRIGFITDLSGPYVSVDGPGGAHAIRMAVADMSGALGSQRVEVMIADHQNKPEVAAAQARAMFERGADVLIGGVNTDTSLAMVEVAREKKKPFLVVGAGSTAHTREKRSPYTIQYAYDTATLSQVAGRGVVEAGGKSWFFLTSDYPFGRELEIDTENNVKAAGGSVVGAVRHPHETPDFSPFMLQARDSGAQVLGLASGHTALTDAVKAANKIGLTPATKIAGLLVFIDDIHTLGLEEAQGMFHADSWYWNRDAASRAWGRRFLGDFGRMPSSLHAGDYSAALQYLKAVQTIDSDDADRVLAQLRKTEFNDMFAQNGHIREDGLMVHDMYLLRVKSPQRSTELWDYDDIIETVNGDVASGNVAGNTPATSKRVPSNSK